jgi:hypothetical protein
MSEDREELLKSAIDLLGEMAAGDLEGCEKLVASEFLEDNLDDISEIFNINPG